MNEQSTTSDQVWSALIHEALLYRSEKHLSDVVAEFAADAARRREPILVVLPSGNDQLVRTAIEGSGADAHFEDMAARGRNPACLLELFEDWISEHDRRVRVIDEPVWPGRSHVEVIEVLRHEALVNHVLASAPVSILCAYDTGNLEADALQGAELTHPQLISNGHRRPSPEYGDPLEVHRGARWPQPIGVDPISELTFSGDLHELRAAVASDPLVQRLGRARRADLVFVVNEAATNALKHGDGTCQARLWRDGDTVVSEITTNSQIPDPLAGRRRPEIGAGGGRGLWLINQMCDLVELRSGRDGTTVRMHVRDVAA